MVVSFSVLAEVSVTYESVLFLNHEQIVGLLYLTILLVFFDRERGGEERGGEAGRYR